MFKVFHIALFTLMSTFAFSQTVVDIIVNSADHTTLEAAVIAAELNDDLSGTGPFTVFAPTDAAFAALPAGTVDALLMDPTGDLAKILLHHVLGAEVLSTDLSDGQIATTLLGQGIEVKIVGSDVFINDAKVTVANIDATNGVVHVIDAVLLPAATVVDIVVNSADHTTLEAAVIAAELDDDLSGDGPFTLFAPTDAAFAALPAGTVDALLMDPTGDLAKILLYHAVGAEVLSSTLTNGQVASTLLGQDISVTINADGVFINGDAKVSVTDIRTLNGVVHVIDAVLLPDLTGVKDLEEVKVKVSPNPASSFINIEVPQDLLQERVEAQLIGLNGAILKSWPIEDSIEKVELSNYSSGAYFLFLKSPKSFSRTTIIID